MKSWFCGRNKNKNLHLPKYIVAYHSLVFLSQSEDPIPLASGASTVGAAQPLPHDSKEHRPNDPQTGTPVVKKEPAGPHPGPPKQSGGPGPVKKEGGELFDLSF